MNYIENLQFKGWDQKIESEYPEICDMAIRMKLILEK